MGSSHCDAIVTCAQMELRRLEDAVTEVYEEMMYMRTREEEMRDTNGMACGLLRAR